MRFGFFDQLPCPSGFSERQRYRDFIAQIELGDALGFDTAWLGEIHFSRAFSILADPLMALAAAAQRTTRIRLGTAVTLLPLHNPIRIVEEAATADILSDGRLEFGVGRGVAYQYPGYGIPLEESRERFEEALDFHRPGLDKRALFVQGKVFSGARSQHRAEAPAVAASACACRGQQPRHIPFFWATQVANLRLAANQPARQAQSGAGNLPRHVGRYAWRHRPGFSGSCHDESGAGASRLRSGSDAGRHWPARWSGVGLLFRAATVSRPSRSKCPGTVR